VEAKSNHVVLVEIGREFNEREVPIDVVNVAGFCRSCVELKQVPGQEV